MNSPLSFLDVSQSRVSRTFSAKMREGACSYVLSSTLFTNTDSAKGRLRVPRALWAKGARFVSRSQASA